jgi:DNA-binding NarL/FixJ family response regulator
VPKVFLVSEQPVLLRGFEHALAGSGLEVAAACHPSEFAGTVQALAEPDLAIVDITAGLTFVNLREMHRCAPGCAMVLWTDSLPLELVFKTLDIGVRGIIQRNSPPEQFLDSLRRVAAGELQIGFGSQREMSQPRRKTSLTPREHEIVTLLRQGLRNKQIGDAMSITEGTVKIYLFRLFHKLGVRNRFELARCGILDQFQLSPVPSAQTSHPDRNGMSSLMGTIMTPALNGRSG